MATLAPGLDYVDLDFLGRSQIIATAIIQGPSGVALVDPGPSTTIGNLRTALKTKGLAIGDVRQILLTHIHLDHAGGTGRNSPHNRSMSAPYSRAALARSFAGSIMCGAPRSCTKTSIAGFSFTSVPVPPA